jgi:hypothetical protein
MMLASRQALDADCVPQTIFLTSEPAKRDSFVRELLAFAKPPGIANRLQASGHLPRQHLSDNRRRTFRSLPGD